MKKETIQKMTDEEISDRLKKVKQTKAVQEYNALLDEWHFRYALKRR